MPLEGNDWLAQTQEPALEPDLPICDPHHHFWDFRSERAPYDRYLLPELAADVTSGHNLRSTVFVEARAMYRAHGSIDMRPVGEVEFVQGLAAASASGLYGETQAAAAIVGHADLTLGSNVYRVLEALEAASPNRFQGIRHSTTWDPDPSVPNTLVDNEEGMLDTAQFRPGAEVLVERRLSFDAWLFAHQMPDLARFARALPDLPIILNHIGGLNRVGPYAGREEEVMAQWRANIIDLASCPNVNVKLGGLGMPRNGFDWHQREKPIGSEELAEDMAPLFNFCIEQFGSDRCMFESNFPVDKVSFSYNILWNAFKRLSAGYTAEQRADLFHDTAARVYRIDV